jgi:virulence factor Mce-like protein
MKRGRNRKPANNVAVALVTLAIILPLVYLGFTKSIPFKPQYEVSAVFESSNNLKKGSPVRIAGVEVGKVVKVEPEGKGTTAAKVTMTIGKSGRPIHEDAHAKIRPRIFLEGNFFVDLEPGTPGTKEMGDNATIPIQNTAVPVQFDQLLTSLQSDTRADLKTLLDEYGKALDKGGADAFNRSIPYWKPAYRDTAIVSEASLGELPHDLSNYIKGAGATAAGLDRNSGQLKSLITDFNTTANAFAVQQGNLRAAIAELPNTLHAAQPALDSLNNAFPPLRQFAHDLRPGVQSSGPALDASIPLVHQLRGLVSEDELRGFARDMRPTVPALARLSRESVPLADQNRALAGCQNDVVIPWSRDKVPDEQFPADGPVYTEVGKAFPGLAGESRSGDANGQWFRVLAAGGTNLVNFGNNTFGTTALPILGVNPPKPKARPPLREDVPCETQQTPDLRSNPGAPPEQHKADTSSQLFKDRWAKVRQYGIDLMKQQLKAEGLADRFKVGDKDLTLGDIKQLGKAGK